MDEPAALQRDGHWRLAVWSLRVGYLGLVLAVTGLVLVATGSSAWVLGVGMAIWLSSVVVTLSGFLLARRDLPEPRPTLWSTRWMLVGDTVRRRRPVA